MTLEDVAAVAAAYNRLRMAVMDFAGHGWIRDESANYAQMDLKAALLMNGPKEGIENVKELIQTLKRRDRIKEHHFVNLMRDIQTIRKADF